MILTLCLLLLLALSVTAFTHTVTVSGMVKRQRHIGLSMSDIKGRLSADMKAAMKAKEKVRLGAIRAAQTAMKQKEVDDRVEMTDEIAIEIMAKLIKQRRESVKSYQDAGREDLVAQEEEEIATIQEYLPAQLSTEEIDAIIAKAITDSGASSVKDMGKVMGLVKPQVTGRADMASIGGIIKDKLNA